MEVTKIVEILANEFGFNLQDGIQALSQVNKTNDIEKINKKPKIPLPFCGVINDNWCRGIKLNHGLMTQCTNLTDNYNDNLCKRCSKDCKGRIEDRMQEKTINSYRDYSGKLVTPYSKVMEKLKISIEDAQNEANRLGWTINPVHFEKCTRMAGRPKKSVVVDDTSSDEGEITIKIKKKRGRPKKIKEKKILENRDDIIGTLLENAKEDSSIIELSGIKYIKTSDNVIYDMNTHDEIGIWNDATETLQKLSESEFE